MSKQEIQDQVQDFLARLRWINPEAGLPDLGEFRRNGWPPLVNEWEDPVIKELSEAYCIKRKGKYASYCPRWMDHLEFRSKHLGVSEYVCHPYSHVVGPQNREGEDMVYDLHVLHRRGWKICVSADSNYSPGSSVAVRLIPPERVFCLLRKRDLKLGEYDSRRGLDLNQVA